MRQYRNVKINPEDADVLMECQATMRRIFDKQEGASLAAYVTIFWYSDFSFAIVPTGPEEMQATDALVMVRGAAAAIEDLAEAGIWRKGLYKQ